MWLLIESVGRLEIGGIDDALPVGDYCTST